MGVDGDMDGQGADSWWESQFLLGAGSGKIGWFCTTVGANCETLIFGPQKFQQEWCLLSETRWIIDPKTQRVDLKEPRQVLS